MAKISPPWRRVTDEQARDAEQTLVALQAGAAVSKGAVRAVRTLAKYERERKYAAKEDAKERRPKTFSSPPPGHRRSG